MLRSTSLLAIALVCTAPLGAQRVDPTIPNLDSMRLVPASELASTLDRWSTDRRALGRRYDAAGSPLARSRMRRFENGWLTALGKLPFDSLSRAAQVDDILLRTKVRHELSLLDRSGKQAAEMAPLLPFADTLWAMLEQRRELIRPTPQQAGRRLEWMIDTLATARDQVAAALKLGTDLPSKSVALRTSDMLSRMQRNFRDWQRFYIGYDPAITWRIREPVERFTKALDDWRKEIDSRLVGVKPGEDPPIVGDPIGRDGLVADLANEMIAYTPEELLALAERQFAAMQVDARAASRELGFGDDWMAALNKIKNDYPPVGDQVIAVRDMAHEATDYVMSHDLVTVPALAREIWRMEMMSAQAQKTNPYFLGGETIMVASPTEGQTEAEKIMALRANNLHTSRATVFHELIPGHELQGFVAARSNTQRSLFHTPFYIEGWSLWWEIHLYNLGFTSTPADKLGALFWRMHRAERIIFSLKFHLGQWTPQQCIDFLVEKGGHERAAATGEVRRSFNGNYSPLYQAGYLLGGLQLQALYKELVPTGEMTERQFHDAVLATGPMPIEMVRALLVPSVKLTADYQAGWRFAD